VPRLLLYPFRYRSEITGKWVKARYLAAGEEIAARHADWEIIGPPELRDVDTDARYFQPYRVIEHAELERMQEPAPLMNPHLEQPPGIDGFERFLVALFLRRYVTYCARLRRFSQMQSAAALHREIVAC
jgi:hypothetical protein